MNDINTVSDFQEMILKETGIKTSVKKGTGSMKEYIIFSPMFQNGSYPSFPFEWYRQLSTKYSKIFVSGTSIDLHNTIVSGEPVSYKKERKPKPMDQQSVRQWGSENSQMRLDKKAASYAKKLRQGKNIARYY
jgi:hypothetical protein